MLAFSFTAFADPTFKSVSYYERGEKFRVETAKTWPKCEPKEVARKIFLDKTNELREVAYWDAKGKIHEAGKSNNPEVHKKVNEIFAGTQSELANPCVTSHPGNRSGKGIEQ